MTTMLPKITTASLAAGERVPSPKEVEVVARALQRNDVGGEHDADEVWQAEYQPDGYKDAYRKAAHAALLAFFRYQADPPSEWHCATCGKDFIATKAEMERHVCEVAGTPAPKDFVGRSYTLTKEDVGQRITPEFLRRRFEEQDGAELPPHGEDR